MVFNIDVVYGPSCSGRTELARSLQLAYKGEEDSLYNLERTVTTYTPIINLDEIGKDNYYKNIESALANRFNCWSVIIDGDINTEEQLLYSLKELEEYINSAHPSESINLQIHCFRNNPEASIWNANRMEELVLKAAPLDLTSVKDWFPLWDINITFRDIPWKPHWLKEIDRIKNELRNLEKEGTYYKVHSSLLQRVGLRNPWLIVDAIYIDPKGDMGDLNTFDELMSLILYIKPDISLKKYQSINELVEIHREYIETNRSWKSGCSLSWRVYLPDVFEILE